MTCQALVPIGDGQERVCRGERVTSLLVVLRGVRAFIDVCEAHADLTEMGEPCECGRPTSVCKFTCDFCTGGSA